ncbi:MAG: thiamine pyrophosphate-dependent dehydrogenase E1 component subunit alpha [Planctomycetes bacterium]|nr:thiamine pyrophosphate-dependent dehydrogenase E1 component subunit alpha [Planctomycetota bacterium]
MPRELLERAYYFLCLTRMVEDRAAVLYRQGKIHGGNFSSRGQEAISVGTALALEPQDKVAPMIRNLGAVLVRGHSPREVFASYLARDTSPNGGKDNSTHFGDIEKTGVVACISMLGTLVPVMAGMALAAKLQGRKLVTLTYIGDGATSTGEFHEGLNFAAVFEVPFVLVIENNQYAYSTPIEKQTRVRPLAKKAEAYAIPWAIGDGNDVQEVYRLTKRFVEEARRGGGPRILEFQTMRMRGHAQHDDFKYVPGELLAEWEKKDPLLRCEQALGLSEKEKQAVAARVEREVAEAEKDALDRPHPDGRDAVKGVFADDSITQFQKWWDE